ncbi:MAG: NAD(P)/FAD-dependent oxidoreductase [Candidatus Omnitrophica bacterium]|nr:NAD(P)/FAD-dependent oxidoreductase [Candidatus Omnitrophota bacterium]
MENVDIVVIGAGVVGLAIAERLSKDYKSIYLLERHGSFGQETSSRNSEVIHAGIYYPIGSLKAKLCVEGNRMLYEICSRNNIAHSRIGKLIVATNEEEEEELVNLFERGKENGAAELKLLSSLEVKALEPHIQARAAMYSPSTGIIDTHALMKYFEEACKHQGGEVTYNCKVTGIVKSVNGYVVDVREASGESFTFNARVVINSAGLESDTIAQMAGIDIMKAEYGLKYCKGRYFRVANQKKCAKVSRLIYPVPHEKAPGLGVHVTKDLAGGMRLGPDMLYIDRSNFNYDVEPGLRTKFFESAVRFLPFLEEHDLTPDTAGIRPKLQGENENFRDFIIAEESARGLPGLINLIGIESPGLTCAPAIARYVADLARRILA